VHANRCGYMQAPREYSFVLVISVGLCNVGLTATNEHGRISC